MKLIVACTLLVATAFANPIPEQNAGNELVSFNQTMTLEKFDKVCTAMQDMAVSKGYFPSWAVDPICKLDNESKKALVDLVNDFHAGKVTKPTSNDETIKMIRERSPAAADAFQSVIDEFYARLKKIPQNLQDLQKKWEDISYASADADRLTWFTNFATHAKEYVTDIEGIDENGWAELRKQFPEFEKLQKSEPLVLLRKLITDMKPEELTDKEQIKRLFKMIADRINSKVQQQQQQTTA